MIFRILLTLVVVGILDLSVVFAADKFRAGESVAFLYEKQWIVGTIVQVERGRAMVSAELDGEATQGVFALSALRRPPWTVGSRFWSDESGKFRVNASVVDVSDDALQLLKPDGDKIAVPISRLSKNDQVIAAKLVSAKQAYEASHPVGTTVAEAMASEEKPPSRGNTALSTLIPLNERAKNSIDLDQEPSQSQKLFRPRSSLLKAPSDIEPAPLNIGEPLLADFPQATVRYNGYRDEKIDRLHPVGGENAWLLAQVTRPAKGVKPKALRWISLRSGKTSAPLLLAEGEHVACVEPRSGRFLTRSVAPDEDENEHYQWRVYAGGREGEPAQLQTELRLSFTYSYDGIALPSFLPGNRLLLQGGRDLKVVDLGTGEIVWAMDYVFVSHSHCLAQLSPDRRYLLFYLHHDAPVKRMVVDLQTFELVHCSSIPNRTFEAFTPDGKHLVSMQDKQLSWLNTETWQSTRTEEIRCKWAGKGTAFHVLDDRYLIDREGHLLDLQANEIVDKIVNEGVAANARMPPKDAWVGSHLFSSDSSGSTKVIASLNVPSGG